ncbi:MAG: site-2 protease family protein [Anaerolineales bacterium]
MTVVQAEPGLAERLIPYVRQVMNIKTVTAGGPRTEYRARFAGRLFIDSQEAFDRLQEPFNREGVRVVFRRGEPAHLILAVAMPRPTRSNPWINLALFLATSATVLFAGLAYSAGYQTAGADSDVPPSIDLVRDLPLGIAFAVSLLSILSAHEFGHDLAARSHGTEVSLPYFLPLPSQLGTLGAFIQLKEPPRDRRALLDIGLSGPVAGLAVAIPVLALGLYLSDVSRLPSTPEALRGLTLEGNSVLYLSMKYLITGKLLPEPVSYGGVSPLLYWIRYVVTAQPAPVGGLDVLLHPIAWAGWAGLLVTALNLIPAGQLDGGHVLYVLVGRLADWVRPLLILGLLALGTFWAGWWIWAFLLAFLGRGHARPLDEITPLNSRRRLAAMLALVVLLLLFMPVPLVQF